MKQMKQTIYFDLIYYS